MLLALTLAACDGAKTDDTAAASDFDGGSFQFTTTAVDDQCLDGAFDTLLMPEGADTPYDWENSVEIPAVGDMPSTYTITVQAPYNDITVTVENPSADKISVAGAQATGVEFDPDTYPGCTVDNSIDVDLTIVDADTLQGTAVLHTSNVTGDSCPIFDADPCDVTLDVTAARIE
jgi:hypothetical protein